MFRNSALRAISRLSAWFVVTVCLALSQTVAAQTRVDATRLELIEDLSESFANDMLELSVAVRNHDLQRMADFFAARVAGERLPAQPTELKPSASLWISSHGWAPPAVIAPAPQASEKAAADPASASQSREQFLRDWGTLLDHLGDIEDVRFKVKQANFDDPNVPLTRARLAFFIIGRDRDGRREWIRGTAQVSAQQAEDKLWKIASFALTSLESMVATTDLFSEIAAPAGVEVTVPPYGSPTNSGFAWRGAVAGDLNNDGLIDLFVTGNERNYLYLNDGQGKFRDVSAEAQVQVLLSNGTQPVIFDYDNDGDGDVFISAVGSQMLLENRFIPDGKLEFRDVSLEAGVAKEAIGFGVAVGDVNGDGLPDIYVACYNRYGTITPDSWFQATNGTPNLLFVNQGKGKFREEAVKWGVADSRWSYAAAFADVNDDGKLDLYVSNDFGENGLFVNKGDKFVDEAKERGVLDPGNGMGAAFGDINNDGRLDLHSTNMSSTAGNRILSRLFPQSSAQDNVLMKLASGNSLFENLGGGRYRDMTADIGGLSASWAWGGGFIDFDNDGWEDLYSPNGFISGKSMKDT